MRSNLLRIQREGFKFVINDANPSLLFIKKIMEVNILGLIATALFIIIPTSFLLILRRIATQKVNLLKINPSTKTSHQLQFSCESNRNAQTKNTCNGAHIASQSRVLRFYATNYYV